MPWATPTLRQVRGFVRDSIHASLPGSDANVPNSILRVLADAMGALCHLTLQYLDWLSKMLLPDTAETLWLDRHGKIWLVNSDGTTGRKQATLASGQVTATGQNGTIVPTGTTLSSPDGVEYETTAQVIISGLPTPIPVRAIDPGAASNMVTGSPMAFDTPPVGLDRTVLVLSMIGGADIETDDELRARVLQRIQQPPMGGDESDYEAWALAVPGVTRAWANALEEGMGTCTVRFCMDDLRAENNGIPYAEDVVAVQNYIDVKRPVAVKDIFVVAPIPFPISFKITQLVDDTTATRASIETMCKEMFFEKSFPGCTIYRSWLEVAIANAIGEQHHELEYTTTTAPTPGHLPILGSIIYAGG